MLLQERWVRESPPGLLSRYHAHVDAILLTRLRWSAALGLAGVGLVCLRSGAVAPAARGTFLFFQVTFIAGCLLAWGLTHVRLFQGRATALVVATLVGGAAHMALCFHLLDQDRGATAAGFVGLALGSATLFPWGLLPQAVIGLGSLAGYLIATGGRAGAANLFDLALVVDGVGVSFVGAWLLAHHRFEAFKESWQRERLVAFGSELAAQMDVGAVTDALLEHGMSLLGADGGAVALRDATRPVYRIDAVGGRRHGGRRWLVGLEFPEDVAEVREILREGDLEAATTDPRRTSFRPIADIGIQRVLMVALRHATDVVGIVCFARRAATPFDGAACVLARNLANQATLALQTARMVADLRAANQARSDFVSTMSHELRTPLNVIVGYAQMARDGAGDPEEHADTLERIEAAGRELLELIEGTLEIGRIEAGRDAAQLERVDLRAFWHELGTECRRMLRRQAVVFEWTEPAPAVLVTTDPRKLRVTLRNLVGNALKFTEAGHVRGEATVDGDTLRLRISDTGIGIRAEDHELVFEMFRQADGSDSRRYGGTGLGLYIVRRFVQQLGGTVTLESAPGRGATFTLVFPGIAVGSVRAA